MGRNVMVEPLRKKGSILSPLTVMRTVEPSSNVSRAIEKISRLDMVRTFCSILYFAKMVE